MKAYCYASGQIEFGRSAPEGTIVPGVPEAPNQKIGLEALMAFRDQVSRRLNKARAR